MGEKISLNNILIDYWGMVSYHTSSPLFESICRYYTTTYRFYTCTRKEEKQKAKEKGIYPSEYRIPKNSKER